MGQQYDNKQRFTLFKNKKKQAGDNKPDYTGKLTDAEGREFWLSAWIKSPQQGGDKFLSGTVRPVDETTTGNPNPRGGSAPAGKRQQPPAEDGGQPFREDDIPF